MKENTMHIQSQLSRLFAGILFLACVSCFCMDSIGQNRELPPNMLSPKKDDNRLSPRTAQTIPITVRPQNQPNEVRVNHIPADSQDQFKSLENKLSATAGSQSATIENDPLDKKLAAEEKEVSANPIASIANIQDMQPVLKVVGGLCVVIAIFFAFTILARKSGAKVNGKIPEEIFQVLGQMPLDSKRQLQLVRFGSKILLLNATDKMVQPIGEIEDPIEVEHVMSLIQSGRAADAFASFRRITSQMRQQRRAQRLYPSNIHPDSEIAEPQPRLGSTNVFEA